MTIAIRRHFSGYRLIGRDNVLILAAYFCLLLINSAFNVVLNLFMLKRGYADYEIAHFISYRFLAVMLFAVPFGWYIRGRALRPLFWASAISLPLFSLVLVESVEHRWSMILSTTLVLWGVAFSGISILILPYLIRNVPEKALSEAIAFQSALWYISLVATGSSIAALSAWKPAFFNEYRLLMIFSMLGFLALWLLARLRKPEINAPLPSTTTQQHKKIQYNWLLIAQATFPTLLIAIGAGFTIPFMSLFLHHVFGLSTANYAILETITSTIVAITLLFAPLIKARFGYMAIPITQTAAIIALILLGYSDFISTLPIAFSIAIICYIARQPLMSLANPLTAELTMHYVGKANQEMMSAITASIWSGSWFISSQIFSLLRAWGIRYGYTIWITAALYVVGVGCYIQLIRKYKKMVTLV